MHYRLTLLLTLFIAAFLFSNCSYNQLPDPTGPHYVENIKQFRKNKRLQFKDTASTPFRKVDLKRFDRLNYFDIKKKYVVWAQFERIEPGEPFIMPTTGSQKPYYIRYGKLRFTVNGKAEELTVYKNIGQKDSESSENYLFVPFKDETNGKTTYSGGRYLEFQQPLYNGQLIKLDFNKAYNPFCVYNYDKFDCPIPPKENHLDVSIRAGEKMYEATANSQISRD